MLSRVDAAGDGVDQPEQHEQGTEHERGRRERRAGTDDPAAGPARA